MKNIRYKNLTWLLMMGYALMSASLAYSSQADLDKERDDLIKEYKTISSSFETDKKQAAKQIKVLVQELKWSGIADEKLFDPMEKDLLSIYLSATGGAEVEYSSWLVQALAFSGQDKYKQTINKVQFKAGSEKTMRHAQTSFDALPKYSRWNPVISTDLDKVDYAEVPRKRVVNMLNATDPELVRAGASHILSQYKHDKEMLENVKQVLLAIYKDASKDNEYAEAAAWLCKVLGSSGDRGYLPVLEEVKNNTNHKTVLRWAEKSIKML